MVETPFVVDGYTLYRRFIHEEGEPRRAVYFFAKGPVASAEPAAPPPGFGVTKAEGRLPILVRQGSPYARQAKAKSSRQKGKRSSPFLYPPPPSFLPTYPDVKRKTQKPAEIFVLTPFEEEFRHLYLDHIKKVAKRLQKEAARADDFFRTGPIIRDIYYGIAESRIVIADCTDKRANVFYEIGLAHALQKPVVLIARSIEDVPFDLRHNRVILYSFTPRGMRLFEQALTETLKTELE